MTKKSSKSKMTDQTALSYGFGKTTLGKILVATSDTNIKLSRAVKLCLQNSRHK